MRSLCIIKRLNPWSSSADTPQLNRGERRHQLARRLFFANQGAFQTGDYDEIMNKATCLSLLSNAVVVWNTVQMTRIIDQLRCGGDVITDDELARVSPLAFAHVISNGTYFGLFRNSRENRTSFRCRPNISNGLARRESEF